MAGHILGCGDVRDGPGAGGTRSNRVLRDRRVLQKAPKEALPDETHILINRIAEQGVGGVIGGFPCQDISFANPHGAATSGLRSGLFREGIKTFRLVGAEYLLLENVAALFARGMGIVLGALASLGCDAEWDCVGAGTVGAPHHRARAYILAHYGRSGGERLFPKEIRRQPEFSWCENVRSVEDMRGRSDIPEPLIRRISNGARERLHAIGNGNPPCVIRELTRGLK